MPFTSTIVATAIDPSTLADFAHNGISNINVPIWSIGTAIYQMVRHELIPGQIATNQIAVYKSLDGGVTWNVQDQANEPDNSSEANNFLDGTTVYVLVGPRSDQNDVALRLYSFDCQTDTWTLIDGTGPVAHWPCFVSRLTTGDFLIAYGHIFANDIWVASFVGGVWTVIQDLTLVTAVSLDPLEVYGCLDATDRTHLAFNDTATRGLWHVSFSAGFALGPVDAFLGNPIDIGSCLAVGSSIMIAVLELGALTIYSGTPLAIPTFATVVADPNPPDFPKLVYDATNAQLVCVYGDWTTEEFFSLTTTTDLTGLSGWVAAVVIYDINTDTLPPNFDVGTPFVFPPGVFTSNGNVFLSSNYHNTVTASDIAFYVGVYAFGGGVIGSGGGPIINAEGLPVIPLPSGFGYLDANGAAKQCFPMKYKGRC